MDPLGHKIEILLTPSGIDRQLGSPNAVPGSPSQKYLGAARPAGSSFRRRLDLPQRTRQGGVMADPTLPKTVLNVAAAGLIK
jgi:hypothetical protein